MKKRAVIVAITLITIWMVVDDVRDFVANDTIHYFADQPHRLLYVVAIAGVGGVLVWAFSRLSPASRRGLMLFGRYAVVLLVAYIVAWTGAFIFLFRSVGESVRWDSYGLCLYLAWISERSKLLNQAWLHSVVGFIPLAVLAVVLMRRLGRQKHEAA